MTDQRTREYLQGYGSALADFNRLFDDPVRVYEALQQAGLDYHSLMDAGLETQDLGEIARCRDAWKARPADRTSGQTIRALYGRGRAAGKNPPLPIPDGCIIHIFDDASGPENFKGAQLDTTNHGFGHGRQGWITLDTDPDMLLGAEPSQFVDHTTKDWPARLKEMIEWRSWRHSAPIVPPDTV